MFSFVGKGQHQVFSMPVAGRTRVANLLFFIFRPPAKVSFRATIRSKYLKKSDKFDIILDFMDIIVIFCLLSPVSCLLSPVFSPNERFLIFAGELLKH
jgi:hypothetical protein